MGRMGMDGSHGPEMTKAPRISPRGLECHVPHMAGRRLMFAERGLANINRT